MSEENKVNCERRGNANWKKQAEKNREYKILSKGKKQAKEYSGLKEFSDETIQKFAKRDCSENRKTKPLFQHVCNLKKFGGICYAVSTTLV